MEVVCFLGKQELAFFENNETESSPDPENHKGLLHLLASKGANLDSAWHYLSVFRYIKQN